MQTYLTSDIKVGQNKGAPRVWLEGKRLAKAGFVPGAKYALAIGDKRVTLSVSENGTRVVSAKHKADTDLPVIDINSAQALGLFEGLDRLRVIIRQNEIHLLPLATQKKAEERLTRIKAKLENGEPLRVASFCHGGGVLSLALHEGMKQGGVESILAMANDINPEVLFHAAQNNPVWNDSTQAIAAPMQEFVADDWLLDAVGKSEVLECGIPCVGASKAGRSKKHLSKAEDDVNCGHLVVAFLGIVQALQPAIVIVENVVAYLNTASASLIRYTLRDWGYDVQETVLDAHAFGAIEDRKRMAMVATTKGLSFDLSTVQPPANVEHRKLGDVLEDVDNDASCWSSMDYLRKKEVADIAAGKGFRMAIGGPDDDRVGTIGRGYGKVRSTEIKIRHPIDGDARLRQLSPREHAAVKGVPEQLIEGLPATRAHELLGNGICFEPFRVLGFAIASALVNQPTPQRSAESEFKLAA